MKRLQKVAFDELLPKMALENAFSTSFYNVLMIWITPNFVSLIFLCKKFERNICNNLLPPPPVIVGVVVDLCIKESEELCT